MVTDLAEFKATKAAKAQPSGVSRRWAMRVAGDLLSVLADSEKIDLELTFRFDLTTDDITAISSFTHHLLKRIQDRNNAIQRKQRTEDQPAS